MLFNKLRLLSRIAHTSISTVNQNRLAIQLTSYLYNSSKPVLNADNSEGRPRPCARLDDFKNISCEPISHYKKSTKECSGAQ